MAPKKLLWILVPLVNWWGSSAIIRETVGVYKVPFVDAALCLFLYSLVATLYRLPHWGHSE
jgi:hypothetical protein